MLKQRLVYLFDGWKDGRLTEQERAEFMEEAGMPGNRELLENLIEEYIRASKEEIELSPIVTDAIWKSILESEEKQEEGKVGTQYRQRTISLKWKYLAASLIFLLATGIVVSLYIASRSSVSYSVVRKQPSPGKEKEGAVLTLADGTKIVLDGKNNEAIASQHNTQISMQNGQLVYKITNPGEKEALQEAYNTIATPRGRQFGIILPDGTKVWLNTASSLKYPVAFTTKERKVEIEGEAFFEVAKNAGQPFRVLVNPQAEIEVLGTSFNVNAYNDEDLINTALLEGSVKVISHSPVKEKDISHSSGRYKVLSPGQQAVISSLYNTIAIEKADINKVMSWRKGVFDFDHVSIDKVMKQLSRWYDLDIVYEKGLVPEIYFGGKMSMDLTLPEVLDFLRRAGVHYKMEEEKRLIITQ